MQFVIADTYESVSAQAAQELISFVNESPYCVLGLATGSTPLGMYSKLVEAYHAGEVSFENVTTFNLDEYWGIDPANSQSYRHYMDEHFFNLVNIDKNRTSLPQSQGVLPQVACNSYDELIFEAGGIDFQLLGLGNNGHIGFNEPAPNFPVGTHLVDLAPSTIQANSRLFSCADEVPRQAITMGIGTIMHARKVVVLVSGAGKAEIVVKAFEGPVVPEVPASILQLHPHVEVILDRAAASQLSLA